MWTAGARHMVIKNAGNPSQVLYDYCSYPLPILRTLTPYRHLAERDGVEAVRKQLLTKECNVTICLTMKGIQSSILYLLAHIQQASWRNPTLCHTTRLNQNRFPSWCDWVSFYRSKMLQCFSEEGVLSTRRSQST